jgi:phosphate-selective porin OprO and OprP
MKVVCGRGSLRAYRIARRLIPYLAVLSVMIADSRASYAQTSTSAPQAVPAISSAASASATGAAAVPVASPAGTAAIASLPADVENAADTTAAASDLEKRIRDLEATVQQLQGRQAGVVSASQLQVPPPPAPAADDVTGQGPYLAPESPAFNPIGSEGGPEALIEQEPFKGFYIQSPDKVFSLRITGQVQADYREYLNTKDRTDIDTFLLRRARFGLEATLGKYWEFRFLPDFGNGTTIIQDAYMNVHYWDCFEFEVGRFKQPISYEQLIQDRYVPTLERSLMDQLVPARDLGAMIHGEQIFDNRLDYAISLSNGEINGNSVDLNNHKDLDARVSIRPLNDESLPEWLHYFGIGVSGGFGIEQEPMSPATLRMPDTVPFFNFNSTVRADGLRTRLCPELYYYVGPFGFLAQYYDQHQDLRPNSTGPGYKYLTDVPFTGYTLLSTLLLTGETRTTWSEQLKPLRDFDPRAPLTHPGAWELVARVSRLDVGDVFNPGNSQLANPAKNSNEAMDVTVGFNWYFNAWVRMQFNYEHDMFGQPVLLGTTAANELKSQDSLFTRFQVIF